MIWFSSDWHFGHEAMLKHQLMRGADFSSVEAMDAAIVDGINAVVKPNDTLYCLGDFGWQARRHGHYRARLNVRQLHIVRGNHDRPSLARHCSTFTNMKSIKVRAGDLEHPVKIHMCHYPILSWDAVHRGGIHLYGHCHGTIEDQFDSIFPSRRSMDVGIDNIHRLTGEWRPISFDEVFERFGGAVVDRRLPGPFEEVTRENDRLRDALAEVAVQYRESPSGWWAGYTCELCGASADEHHQVRHKPDCLAYKVE